MSSSFWRLKPACFHPLCPLQPARFASPPHALHAMTEWIEVTEDTQRVESGPCSVGAFNGPCSVVDREEGGELGVEG